MSGVPARPPRDTRLDIVRGWMQVSIFVSHVMGTSLAWGIHAAWGLSDSSEQFILLSGFALGSVFTLKAARDGVATAQRDLLRRAWELYRTQLRLFFGFAAMVLAVALLLRNTDILQHGGWCLLVDAPWEALPGALLLLYQPEYMGILPGFVVGMLLLGPFLRLVDRIGAWALLPSLAVWAAVQIGWLRTPGIGQDVAFDPLAWQLLYLIGGLLGRNALLGIPIPRHAALRFGALAVVVLGFAARIVEHGFVAGPGVAAEALQHKEVLAPARLLHALALAYLVALWMPRAGAWSDSLAGRWLARIGRHSLEVFCAGLYAAWLINTLGPRIPAGPGWLDALVVPAGVALLGVQSWLVMRRQRAA
ncbi:succinyl transferase OpgC [Roseomonas terrae]|uniref:Succinyl transferase OpgC n=1 Tax=Neoroseomonas terrae TaxID=424799 RepID=A0ABS5EEH1_9PROT|nr:succinyl transferase OpgC [Neoroseomonas terrae]